MNRMAPSFVVVVILSATIPSNWESLLPWVHSSTQQEIWESLEECDPNDPRSVRVLDEMMSIFRSRTQFYLLKQWSRHFERIHEGSALGYQALAWRCWMLPKEMRDEADLNRLESWVREKAYPAVWREIIDRCSEEISGVLAARLAELSRSVDLQVFVEKTAREKPESAIAAWSNLRKGMESGKGQDWEEAANRWLEGLENYPVLWEREEWCRRIEEALRLSGHAVQAEVIQEGGFASLPQLRQLRKALVVAAVGDSGKATRLLEDLKGQELKSTTLLDLVESHLETLRLTEDSPHKQRLTALLTAPPETLSKLLAALASNGLGTADLEAPLFSVAKVRYDRGEIAEAVRIWEYLIESFKEPVGPIAEAFARLLDIRWKQYSILRDLELPHPGSIETGYIRPLIERNIETVSTELGRLLESAEDFVRKASEVNDSLSSLVEDLYEIHLACGHETRPDSLFLDLARKSPPEEWKVLAHLAERFRPSEALAIHDLARNGNLLETASETELQSLLSLYDRQERFREAAAIARQLAEEATGTPAARSAWFRVADLEYKAGDYETAAETLNRILDGLEEGTPDHTEATRLLGLTEYHRGDYEEAQEHFRSAIDSGNLGKDQIEKLAILAAYSSLYRQRYDEARTQLNRVLELGPSRLTERKVTRLLQQIERSRKNR